MRRPVHYLLIASCLLGVVLTPVQSQTPRRDTTKRDRAFKPTRSLPPTTWDSETERLFASDPTKTVRGERPQIVEGESESSAPSSERSKPNGRGDGSFAWSEVIASATVVNEIKGQLPPLESHLRSSGAFKRGNRKVGQQYAVVAVMFGIAAEYDGTVRWQGVAAAARDAFARASSNAKANDANAFREARSRRDDLSVLVRGGSVEFRAPQAEFLWSDLADRRLLMQRFEVAHNERLRRMTSTESELSRNRATVIHEAEIIAALAEVIQRDEFEFYDDDDYLAFCKQLQQQAREVVEAVEANDFAKVGRHVGEISKTCSACHEGYK